MGTWDDLRRHSRARAQGERAARRASTASCRSTTGSGCATSVARKEHGGADGRGDDWLRVGGLKGFVDGSLGSHTAAFQRAVQRRAEGSRPAGEHAGGSVPVDLGRRQGRPPRDGPRDRRSRQRRCCSTSSSASAARTARAIGGSASSTPSTCAPRDIPRFAQLGVIASMQPYHAIDDGRWAETVHRGAHQDDLRVPLAARRAARRSRSAATGSSRRRRRSKGSTPPSRAARSTTSNPAGWVPEQKITVEEALRAYTASAAYASFDEARKGVLSHGRLADFVMLDRNIFEIPPEEIRAVRVRMTIVGGKTGVRRRALSAGSARDRSTYDPIAFVSRSA